MNEIQRKNDGGEVRETRSRSPWRAVLIALCLGLAVLGGPTPVMAEIEDDLVMGTVEDGCDDNDRVHLPDLDGTYFELNGKRVSGIITYRRGDELVAKREGENAPPPVTITRDAFGFTDEPCEDEGLTPIQIFLIGIPAAAIIGLVSYGVARRQMLRRSGA
ncbi:MAG: hypothetical protein Q4P33_00520 [Flaviflexus sp.]|nr:hypothetical protein [Flaviflexus sp.]